MISLQVILTVPAVALSGADKARTPASAIAAIASA